MKELIPLKENCEKVKFTDEIKKAKTLSIEDKFISAKLLIKHLNWLKKNKVELYIKPNSKVNFVYIFEYKGLVCRFSALTLKIHFTGKSSKEWYRYSMDQKLIDTLSDKETKEINIEASKDTVLIDLNDFSTNYNEILSNAQFDYICALINKSKSFDSVVNLNHLSEITKKTASLLIQALKNDKKLVFIDRIEVKPDYEISKSSSLDDVLDLFNKGIIDSDQLKDAVNILSLNK